MFNFQQVPIVLNRFFVKKLTEVDRKIYEYSCNFKQNPEYGKEQRALSSVCYKLGVPAVRLGSKIITKEPVDKSYFQGDNWTVNLLTERILDCSNHIERKGVEQLERQILRKRLKEKWSKTSIEKASEGGLIWWVEGKEGTENCGAGWEVHRGRRIDVNIDADAAFYLEIDLHHRFYTPWTLHQWQDEYPDIPINYVRNTYKDENNQYLAWKYEDIGEQTPEQFIIEGLGITLADYHRSIGATEEEIKHSHVVYVTKYGRDKQKLIPHLSYRLSPCLTMDMLASIAEQSNSQDLEKKNVRKVFNYIKKSLDIRLKESEKTAHQIIEEIYKIPNPPQALIVNGHILPKGKLFAKNGEVDKAGEVRYKGCVKTGEVKFGCLNLFNNLHKYPEEVEKCLKEVAEKSGVKIDYNSYKTSKNIPSDDLDRQMFWQEWAETGVQTILVVAPWLSNDRKKQIRIEALQAGIATQFMLPQPKADAFKAMNVVLGLLCKAGWQTVRLEPLEHPEAADLIIGFDTGTNRELYYGTSAFAILADGQSLGWELPDVQRGESFSGEAVWQTVSKLIAKFREICDRFPKRLLLMRDGLVQEGEFKPTIKALEAKGIAVDVVSVRKSGAGRMGSEIDNNSEKVYRDASVGSVVFTPQESSFILMTSQPIKTKTGEFLGSARPLRVVREYGDTSLELLALQTYHLTQLHPASGFRSSRLPWVLHLADRNSKEFQRIGQISILQNLSREKLIAV
jgi:argonaute family protein